MQKLVLGVIQSLYINTIGQGMMQPDGTLPLLVGDCGASVVVRACHIFNRPERLEEYAWATATISVAMHVALRGKRQLERPNKSLNKLMEGAIVTDSRCRGCIYFISDDNLTGSKEEGHEGSRICGTTVPILLAHQMK
jgi:hypothetical protein